MKRKIISLFLLMSTAFAGAAQDFHLSQYEMAAHYLNPALTGMYGGEKGDYRFAANYRSQWLSPSLKPYSTAYLSYDMPVSKWNQHFGLGGYIINNRSGVSSINTFNFILSGAYNITGNSKGKHMLTTGLQVGVLHRSFDPSSYTYDVQYSASMDGFDSSIPNEENFAKSSLTGFDANFGIHYKFTEKGRNAHPFGGLSVYHVTQPNESFSANKIKTPMRFNFHGGCDIAMNENVKITPRVLYMNQARATELNAGLLTYYRIGSTPYEAIFQCDYRSKDAVIVGLGLRQNEQVFRLAYDINTSALGPYLGGRGSWEFSLILTGRKGRPLFTKVKMRSRD
jgi:type IX secretion system PorP/SprF family membrane protein